MNRSKIIQHYKSFFDIEDMGLDENDHLMIDWAEDLVKNCIKPPRTENKKFIAEQERVIAAKYFTISNLAMEQCMEESGNDLDRAFDTVEGIIMTETGCTVDEEFRDWKKMIDNGDRYCFDEWQKIRTKYVK